MEYSITSLAKKARVTVRTLRHYDQIGLLKPSIRMANGKRVYSDEEAMRLLEIVFFKKVGIGLPKIKEMFRSKESNQAVAAALIARRQALAKEIKRLQRHATYIETALPQYKDCSLNRKERFEKFLSMQDALKEIEEIQIKEFGKEEAEKIKQKIEALSEEQIDAHTDQAVKILKTAVKAVEHGVDPSSKEIQAIVKCYYDSQVEFGPMTKEIFLKHRDVILAQREYYSAYHQDLPEFLYKAFDSFANSFFNQKTRDEK